MYEYFEKLVMAFDPRARFWGKGVALFWEKIMIFHKLDFGQMQAQI